GFVSVGEGGADGVAAGSGDVAHPVRASRRAALPMQALTERGRDAIRSAYWPDQLTTSGTPGCGSDRRHTADPSTHVSPESRNAGSWRDGPVLLVSGVARRAQRAVR